MTRKLALTILKSIPSDCTLPHPQAIEGTLDKFKRASDKKEGKTVHHYYQKEQLYYVCV